MYDVIVQMLNSVIYFVSENKKGYFYCNIFNKENDTLIKMHEPLNICIICPIGSVEGRSNAFDCRRTWQFHLSRRSECVPA